MEHLNEKTLNALADGRLFGKDAQQAEAHLDGCSHCREELEALRLLISGMDAVMAEPPSSFQTLKLRQRIIASVHRERIPDPIWNLGRSFVYYAIVVGLILGLCMGRISSPLFQPQEVELAMLSTWDFTLEGHGLLDPYLGRR